MLPRRRDYSEFPCSWRRDLTAGVIVAIVALPLALAFGVSSGMGAEAGLVAAIVAGLVAVAVGIGIAIAGFFALRALSAASGVHREELPGPPVVGDERIALFRIDGSLFFGAAERILDRISAHAGIEVVVLRLSQLQLIDATGARTLTQLATSLERLGITVLIKGIRTEHVPVLERLGVIISLRRSRHLFAEVDAAIAHARSHIGRTAAASG
ncbi:sodium-independent anion transporter [Microbacterium sp. Gd 4-13]|uniref:STAS domain-containing protein n=1 Tax=Microbacterium sp. Gd 4-13 TaxID=2173179 RepID=UPI001F0C3341|nr:sodium-independent anion transporter [Microbacterium sp. Gd 4-13]